jgi:hypothetical protein
MIWLAFFLRVSYILFFFLSLEDTVSIKNLILELARNAWHQRMAYFNWYIQAQTVTVTAIKQQAKKVLELIQKYARNVPEVGVNNLY